MISKEPFPVKPFTPGYLKIKGHRIIPIAFVWQQILEKNTRFGVRAPELIANYRLRPDEIALERLEGSIVISRSEEGPIEWTSLYSALKRTNELLRGVTDLLYTLEELMYIELLWLSQCSKVQNFSSPGAFEILLDKSASLVLGSWKGYFSSVYTKEN